MVWFGLGWSCVSWLMEEEDHETHHRSSLWSERLQRRKSISGEFQSWEITVEHVDDQLCEIKGAMVTKHWWWIYSQEVRFWVFCLGGQFWEVCVCVRGRESWRRDENAMAKNGQRGDATTYILHTVSESAIEKTGSKSLDWVQPLVFFFFKRSEWHESVGWSSQSVSIKTSTDRLACMHSDYVRADWWIRKFWSINKIKTN